MRESNAMSANDPKQTWDVAVVYLEGIPWIVNIRVGLHVIGKMSAAINEVFLS
jgi:hypothetical protein